MINPEMMQKFFNVVTKDENVFKSFSEDPISTLEKYGFAREESLMLLTENAKKLPQHLRNLAPEWISSIINTGSALAGIGGIAAVLAEAVKVVATKGGNLDDLAKEAKSLGFKVEIT